MESNQVTSSETSQDGREHPANDEMQHHWGHSPQSAHNKFRIVDHSDDHSTFYIFDQTISPKNMDHTISLLMHHGERLG